MTGASISSRPCATCSISAPPGARLDALVAALPQGYGGRGLNLPGPALARIAGSGLGFYAFLYRHMYNGAGRAYFVRMEHLRDELLKMLTGAGQIDQRSHARMDRRGTREKRVRARQVRRVLRNRIARSRRGARR